MLYIIHRDHLISTDDFCHPSDHLFPFYAIFIRELIIPTEYISIFFFPCYPVQHKCTVFPLIQYDIILFYPVRKCCKCDFVPPLDDKRLHTRSSRIKRKLSTPCENFSDCLFYLFQFYFPLLHIGCSPPLHSRIMRKIPAPLSGKAEIYCIHMHLLSFFSPSRPHCLPRSLHHQFPVLLFLHSPAKLPCCFLPPAYQYLLLYFSVLYCHFLLFSAVKSSTIW